MEMSNKLPISVSIITNNEERILAKTLESVTDFADEIIIVDSGSTDRTIEIAESFGCKVFSEEWKGYAEQKNSSLAKCKNDWILCIDADEVISDELKKSLVGAINQQKVFVFQINRRTHYIDKLLKRAWQPDWKHRLVNKFANPRWEGEFVHETLRFDVKAEKLKGNIIHYSYRDINHHFKKTFNYAKLSAELLYHKGVKFNLANLIFNPIIKFLRLYVINFGFLDGIRGFLACMSAFFYTFLKYALLWELENQGRKLDNGK